MDFLSRAPATNSVTAPTAEYTPKPAISRAPQSPKQLEPEVAPWYKDTALDPAINAHGPHPAARPHRRFGTASALTAIIRAIGVNQLSRREQRTPDRAIRTRYHCPA